jgi:hypothetical protein
LAESAQHFRPEPKAHSGGWIRTTDLRVMSPPL